MEKVLFDSGSIKRADLQLRTKYYGIKTKIYLVDNARYNIYVVDYPYDFDDIRKDFDHNIRRIGDCVELVNQEPKSFIAKITPLTNIAYKNEGIFLTHKMFESLLISKFPRVDFLDIKVEHCNGVQVIITVADTVVTDEISNIEQFIYELKNGFTKVIIKKSSTPKSVLINKDVELACTDKSFAFSIADSEFWFDNVEKIYSGDICKNDLSFFDSEKTKCYMDFSVWTNENINIRSNALLYDTIYLSFPLGSHIDDFLLQQHLKQEDLDELVERKKLVILLPNTESRYNKKALDRLYSIDPNCIVSKRGINALMAMFYCELERRYMSLWESNEHIFEALCLKCTKKSDWQSRFLYDWLLWPIKAKRESYELLTSYSPIKLPCIGANVLFDHFQDKTSKSTDIQFELTTNSNSIHIATALQATYFPFAVKEETGNVYSDSAVSNILGSVINNYQYISANQQDAIKEYTELLEKQRNAIYLLKSDNSVSVKNILDYSEKYNTTNTLQRILLNLSELDQDQQKSKIEEYNNLIAEIGKERFTTINGINYVLSGAGFIPVIGTFASIIDLLMQVFSDTGIKKEIVKKKINKGKSTINDEVYLLDKLSRVAKITY